MVKPWKSMTVAPPVEPHDSPRQAGTRGQSSRQSDCPSRGSLVSEAAPEFAGGDDARLPRRGQESSGVRKGGFIYP